MDATMTNVNLTALTMLLLLLKYAIKMMIKIIFSLIQVDYDDNLKEKD
jgi:hypothetical protein